MKKFKVIKIKGKDVYFISEKIDSIEYGKTLKDKYEKRTKDKTDK